MLNKIVTCEFKAVEGGQKGEFEALVSIFGNVDLQGDRVLPGAFRKTLNQWKRSGDPLPVVLAHEWNDPWAHIGYADPKDVKETARGLYVKGVLDIEDNPVAAQVYKLMKRRSLKQFSFGYSVPFGGEKVAKDGATDLSQVDLIEVGPCLKGANPETELLGVKTALSAIGSASKDSVTIEEVAERLEVLEKTLAELQRIDSEQEIEDSKDEEPNGQVSEQDSLLRVYEKEIEILSD